MALNQIMRDVESQRFVAEVGNNVAPGTPLVLAGVPVVTITGSGDYKPAGSAVVSSNGVSIPLGPQRGGIGLKDDHATVSPTGAYALPVVGATAATITQGATVVYFDATDDTLTLTATDNTAWGVAEWFRGETSATDTVVRIGR